MWLLIDDTRDLNCDVIARNPKAARQCLLLACWDTVCFDHDLGTEESGYDVLTWALRNELLPDRTMVQLVTSNPVGRDRMKEALLQAGYKTVNGRDFRKEEEE